jgi:pimeloyl-ACP methyl ester carboxylesterase
MIVDTHHSNDDHAYWLLRWLTGHAVTPAAVQWFEDVESGTTLKRPAFDRMQQGIFTGTITTVMDLNAVIDDILKLRGSPKVHLLGWSWGTQYSGMFVMAHPEKVAKYVSYAQMHINSPDLAKRRPRLEAFRKTPYISIPEAGWKPRFSSMTPAAANDPAVVDAFAKAAAQVEVKTPTGPQLDMVTLMPMLNPRLMPVPTMIIHGEYDDVADLDALLPFFQQLPNPYKQYVVIPNAGHMMHLQSGHRVFQHEVVSFFKEP